MGVGVGVRVKRMEEKREKENNEFSGGDKKKCLLPEK